MITILLPFTYISGSFEVSWYHSGIDLLLSAARLPLHSFHCGRPGQFRRAPLLFGELILTRPFTSQSPTASFCHISDRCVRRIGKSHGLLASEAILHRLEPGEQFCEAEWSCRAAWAERFFEIDDNGGEGRAFPGFEMMSQVS